MIMWLSSYVGRFNSIVGGIKVKTFEIILDTSESPYEDSVKNNGIEKINSLQVNSPCLRKQREGICLHVLLM